MALAKSRFYYDTEKMALTDSEAPLMAHFQLPDLCKVQPLLFLILTAELLVLVQTLSTGRLLPFDWLHFANLTFFVQWNALLCAAVLCRVRTYIARLPRVRGALLCYALILLVSVLFSIFAQWLLHTFVASAGIQLFDWQRILANLAIVAVIGGITLRYLYLQQQVQVQQQAQLQSHIQALQSRIRPHFLFNSLNSVASLIGSDPAMAEKAVEDLAELFRASLKAAAELVPMTQELALCKRYIAIEQLRMGERLQIDWQVPELSDAVKIPSLTIQPLLENAVYHGIQPRAAGGTVGIKVALKGQRCEITVSNPLPDSIIEGAVKHKGNSMALENTRERLQAHFGADAELTTLRHENRCILPCSA